MSIIGTTAPPGGAPNDKEKEMLTWYYDTPKNIYDAFGIFDELTSRSTERKTTTTDDGNIRIEMPGVRHEDLDVTVEGRTLRIKATSRHGREHTYAYTLKAAVDEGGITASLKDGLLEITLPKKQGTAPRKVTVT